MADLNIETPGRKRLRFYTLPDGRVEIVLSSYLFRDTTVGGKPFRGETGGQINDSVIATIPRSSRALVADWLVSA